MRSRNLITAALCAVAAVVVSAAMTWVVPPPEADASGGEGGRGGAAAPLRALGDGAEPGSGTSAPPAGGPARTAVPPPSGPRAPGSPPAFVGTLFPAGLTGGHYCTATVVRSPGRDLIVTAGHCLTEGPTGSGGAVFAPGYADGRAPYGTWRLTEVTEDPRWARDGEDAYDLAFARLAPDLTGRRVEEVTGAAPLDTRGRTRETVTVTGYPSAADAPHTCTATAALPDPELQRFDCAGFPTGTSGSPWIARDGRIVGVLTGGDTDDRSTSTVLGPWAGALYARATAGR
ncbi:trypsin-like peptidase domain-containing protein [Streptomyces sp. NPDC097619]|uniref:trypsin-like serine peptidase n=1 Tax=Streptomyces sp. NPDC097619 TaxID=3157228 RepID=UPI0033288C32